MKRMLTAVVFLAFAFTPVALAENPAITTDPPRDSAFPAAMDSFLLPTHGTAVNALYYFAAGREPHPTVILLHGFPGNERNLDLAQAIRRAGWNVLFFDYRGSWGSPGGFSFTHCIEDAEAALAYLRDPGNASRLRVDASRLVLIGHSMGGFVAFETAARDKALAGVITISAADMSEALNRDVPSTDKAKRLVVLTKRLEAEGMAPLAGTSAQALAEEATANADRWRFSRLSTQLAARRILAITSDDGLTREVSDLIQQLQKMGDTNVHELHIATDHAYSDHRIALTEAVLAELERISGSSNKRASVHP
jgi:Dipeptidyl aminopeptidases/acylaminoacyl-peptidases